MIRGTQIPNDRLYEAAHIEEVWRDLEENGREYFERFAPDQKTLALRYAASVEGFESGRDKYLELLDADYLEEYEYDPNAFKKTVRNDCPIIHNCLWSQAKVMDKYKAAFNTTSGERLLKVTSNIVDFALNYVTNVNDAEYENAKQVGDLGLSELDSEPYTAYGVIGGGIRSHFLFNLYPDLFPNRNQSAIWSCYLLSGRKDYGFEDCSEFLMVDPNGEGAQQNYFYPYDLFSFYALRFYLFLKRESEPYRMRYDNSKRYIYVNAFLNYVAGEHQEDINALKPFHERYDY